MKTIILITLLFAIAYSQCPCAEGEFFISGDDTTNGICKLYPLETETADPHKYVENCTKYSFDGTNAICDSCANGYYFNDSGACVINDITDCVVQADAENCTQCKVTVFKVDGVSPAQDTCTSAVTGTVQNCMYFQSATECEVCEEGFNLNTDDNLSCVPESVVDNCEVQGVNANGTSKCNVCKDTHSILTAGECSAVENCSEYSGNACSKCASNFFLNSVNPIGCTAYPTGDDIIAECSVYETNGTGEEFVCAQCGGDFFLNSVNPIGCTAYPTGDNIIAECSVYETNGTDEEFVCAQCGGDFFLNSVDPQGCTAYPTGDDIIAECSVYETNGTDEEFVCAQCGGDFFLNSVDPQGCTAYPSGSENDGVIAGCSIYVSSTIGEDSQCGECEAEYWLDTTTANSATCTLKTDDELCTEFTWINNTEACSGCIAGNYENGDGNCAACPEIATSENDGEDGENDKMDDDKQDDDKKDDDKKDDNKKEDEEDKDKNNSASIVSACMGIFSVAIIALL